MPSNIVVILLLPLLLLSLLLLPLLFNNAINIANTSALDYSSNTNLQFTFTPTLSLSISGDLVINDLSPGSSSDSNIIDINVATNNVTGYNLSASVGSSFNNTTNLVNTNNSNYTFISLTSGATNLSDFSPNTWGYSYSVDNGTNWISGNIDTHSNGYNSLPLYNDTNNPGIILNYKNNASSDNIKFKIGALADSTQASGTYTNTINFTAITNPETHYYIQDFTLSECQSLATNDHFTVYDKRDENDYTVRYINGECWMTQNLRFVNAELDSTTSNIAPQYTAINPLIIHYEDLTSGNSYNEARIHTGTSDNGVPITWYNYAAASAMSIVGSENDTDAVYDICPANWHLPSGPNTTENTDFNKLIGNTTGGWQRINHLAIFDITTGGFYADGYVHNYNTQSSLWSSIASSPSNRYYMAYNINSGFYGNGRDGNRRHGNLVRCVCSS